VEERIILKEELKINSIFIEKDCDWSENKDYYKKCE